MLTISGNFLLNNLLFHDKVTLGTTSKDTVLEITDDEAYYFNNIIQMKTITNTTDAVSTYPKSIFSAILNNTNNVLKEEKIEPIRNAVSVNDNLTAYKHFGTLLQEIKNPLTALELPLCHTNLSNVTTDGFLVQSSSTMPPLGMVIFGTQSNVKLSTTKEIGNNNKLTLGTQLQWDNIVDTTQTTNFTRTIKISSTGEEIVSYALPLVNKHESLNVNIYDIGIFGYIRFRTTISNNSSKSYVYIPILFDRFSSSETMTENSTEYWKPLATLTPGELKTLEYRLEKNLITKTPLSS